MIGYTVNNLVNALLKVLNVADDGTTVTGLSTTPGLDFDVQLKRQSGSTYVAASETVTIYEVAGSPGYYGFKFTPQNTGEYTLYVRELDPATMGRDFPYQYNILPAGAVFEPSALQCFCAVSDINRYSGLTVTDTTQVTSQQALAFAEERSSWLMAMCAYWGFSVTPATLDATSRIADLLRMASAIGAALNVVIAWYAQVEPSENEKARQLLTQWVSLVGDGDKLLGVLQIEVQAALSLPEIRTPYSSGEMVPANESIITDGGLGLVMDMRKVF